MQFLVTLLDIQWAGDDGWSGLPVEDLRLVDAQDETEAAARAVKECADEHGRLILKCDNRTGILSSSLKP